MAEQSQPATQPFVCGVLLYVNLLLCVVHSDRLMQPSLRCIEYSTLIRMLDLGSLFSDTAFSHGFRLLIDGRPSYISN